MERFSGDLAGRGLEVVSDAICPWCYVGKRRLAKALALLARDGLTFAVRWLPFQLNPDMPKGGVDRRAYRTRKFGSWERSQALDARVAAVGAGEGLAFRHDLMARTPNTFDAHRLVWLAGRAGGRTRSRRGRPVRRLLRRGPRHRRARGAGGRRRRGR